MPLPVRTIAISVKDIADAAPAHAVIVFTPTNWDTWPGSVILDAPVSVKLDAGGGGSVDLWTTDAGDFGIQYKVQAIYWSEVLGRRMTTDLGVIEVTAGATVSLATLLS